VNAPADLKLVSSVGQAPGLERAQRAGIRVGGMVPMSATDYPGALAAVVFCQGCPWRCGYCHNPHLLPASGTHALDWNDIVAFLRRRRGLLDAVVFSGGEPLAQANLRAAMRQVRTLGYKVGLHTGGAYPDRLAAVLPLVDWIGFDVKAPFAGYRAITGAAGSGEQAEASLELILASGVECEVRTTVHPRLLDPRALVPLATSLAAQGVRRYVLQAFRSTGGADRALAEAAAGEAIPPALAAAIAPLFWSFEVRPS
jgi:pyruvate formate lyase activating enzyme